MPSIWKRSPSDSRLVSLAYLRPDMFRKLACVVGGGFSSRSLHWTLLPLSDAVSHLLMLCLCTANMNMYRFSDRLTGHAFLTLDEPSICSPLVKAEASGTSESNASSHVSSKKNSIFCQFYSRMGSHIGSGYHAAAGTSSKLLPLCLWPVAMNQVLVSPVALSDVNHGEAFAEACRAS